MLVVVSDECFVTGKQSSSQDEEGILRAQLRRIVSVLQFESSGPDLLWLGDSENTRFSVSCCIENGKKLLMHMCELKWANFIYRWAYHIHQSSNGLFRTNEKPEFFIAVENLKFRIAMRALGNAGVSMNIVKGFSYSQPQSNYFAEDFESTFAYIFDSLASLVNTTICSSKYNYYVIDQQLDRE